MKIKTSIIEVGSRFDSNWLPAILTILIALGLKHHYTNSEVDSLRYILAPIALLVEFFLRTDFVMESGEGYGSRESMLVIAKSCAGINFMIIAFCMTSFVVIRKYNDLRTKIFSIAAALTLAYCITIMVNTIRIIISAYSYQNNYEFMGLNGDQVHRIEGIIIYFSCLTFLYWMIQPTDFSPKLSYLPPLFWYLFIMVVVPIFNNGSCLLTPKFYEHCFYSISVPLIIILIVKYIHKGKLSLPS